MRGGVARQSMCRSVPFLTLLIMLPMPALALDQIVMRCGTQMTETNTYRYTRGYVYDTIEMLREAEWVAWPDRAGLLANIYEDISVDAYAGNATSTFQIGDANRDLPDAGYQKGDKITWAYQWRVDFLMHTRTVNTHYYKKDGQFWKTTSQRHACQLVPPPDTGAPDRPPMAETQ